jgi:hypothetical protein
MAAGLASLTAIFATMTFDLQQQQSVSFGHAAGLACGIIGGMSLAFIVLTYVSPIVPEKMFTSHLRSRRLEVRILSGILFDARHNSLLCGHAGRMNSRM